MKCKFYRLCVRNPAAELLQIGRKLEKYQRRHNLLTRPHRQIFFSAVLFFLSNLVTGPSFMSMSSLALELWKIWQLSFIKDWPEIWKSEIPSHEFCPVSGDEADLWYQIWYECLLMKCCWMLKNTRVIAFTAILLLSKNQQEGGRGGGAGIIEPQPDYGWWIVRQQLYHCLKWIWFLVNLWKNFIKSLMSIYEEWLSIFMIR